MVETAFHSTATFSTLDRMARTLLTVLGLFPAILALSRCTSSSPTASIRRWPIAGWRCFFQFHSRVSMVDGFS